MGEIKRITVKGFKSIKSLVDFELGNLNVIVGANGIENIIIARRENDATLFERLDEQDRRYLV